MENNMYEHIPAEKFEFANRDREIHDEKQPEIIELQSRFRRSGNKRPEKERREVRDKYANQTKQ